MVDGVDGVGDHGEVVINQHDINGGQDQEVVQIRVQRMDDHIVVEVRVHGIVLPV